MPLAFAQIVLLGLVFLKSTRPLGIALSHPALRVWGLLQRLGLPEHSWHGERD